MTASDSRELFEPGRLLAFSDGVFGVAITLLVIDLRLPPSLTGNGDAEFLQALREMAPKLVVFVFAFTFIVVGMSWLGHHRKFSYIDKVDGPLLWINLFYLMALCLVPFVSSALGEHGGNRFAFVLYVAVMAIADLLSASLSAYGLRKPFLIDRSALRPGLRRDMILSPLLAGAIFAISAAMALADFARLAHWALITIVPVMAFLGSRTREFVTIPR